MKTKIIFYTNDETDIEKEEVETDASIDTMINLIMNGISLSGKERLYQINRIMAVNLSENTIELECEII